MNCQPDTLTECNITTSKHVLQMTTPADTLRQNYGLMLMEIYMTLKALKLQ